MTLRERADALLEERPRAKTKEGFDEVDTCDGERAPGEPNAFFVAEGDGPLYEVVKRYKTG